MLGIPPSQCSEIQPVYRGGSTWEFYDIAGNWSTSQRCGRGHVRGIDNSVNGGAYGNFIQTQRVLDGDQFWIGIT